MKYILPWIFSLMTAACLVAGVATGIPEKSRVILPGTWTPTEKQVDEALKTTQLFLEKPPAITEREKTEIKKILGNPLGYRVQAWGIIKGERKLVHLNFFPAAVSGEKDFFSHWRKMPVSVDDGGYNFWQIDYDPANGEVVNFSSHGYA